MTTISVFERDDIPMFFYVLVLLWLLPLMSQCIIRARTLEHVPSVGVYYDGLHPKFYMPRSMVCNV